MDIEFLNTLAINKDYKEIEKQSIIKNNNLVYTKRNSYIMVSANNIKHLSKINSLKADIIMFNLEDGVKKEDKKLARYLVGLILSYASYDKEYFVRVNPLDEGGIEDILYLNKFNINGFRIPKIKDIKDIEEAKKLTNKEIHITIETKDAFFNLRNFKGINTFYLGLYDLFNELDLDLELITLDNYLIKSILSNFILDVKYLNAKAIGFIYQNFKDLETFSKWVLLQKNFGFNGVGAITPNQLEIINNIFKTNLDFAKMVVDRFEKEGNFVIDSLFVDEPIYKNFKRRLNENNIYS